MIFGLDIASYQTSPDFAQLRREGHDFMVTKVTGEGNYVNPYWAANRDHARAAGLIVGTYDWVEPQGDLAPDDAARDYLTIVGPRQPGDLLCVDFETPDWHTGPEGREIEGWMRNYLYTLKEASGQPVIVYTAPYFLMETGAGRWDWLGRDFLYWIAAPGQGAMLQDDAPWPGGVLVSPWREATLHQHQWHARSTAVAGEFDRDRFRGTRAELAAYGTPGGTTIGKKEDTGADPDPIVARSYVDALGQPVTEIRWGGQATDILGTDYVDIGITVKNAAGETFHRSIVGGEGRLWVKE